MHRLAPACRRTAASGIALRDETAQPEKTTKADLSLRPQDNRDGGIAVSQSIPAPNRVAQQKFAGFILSQHDFTPKTIDKI